MRKFIKNQSVFKDWKEDTPISLSKTLLNDIKYWKVKKFIKDEQEYNDTVQVLLKFIDKIKKVYIDLISSSTFPSISWIDFSNYSQKVG